MDITQVSEENGTLMPAYDRTRRHLGQIPYPPLPASIIVFVKSGMATMRTYPIYTQEEDRLFAFEVENIYISPSMVANLLSQANGVTEIKVRKIFTKPSDIHVEFNYFGHPHIVFEPYGDSSRYWVGPRDIKEELVAITNIEDIFKRYHPPFYRSLLGDLLSLRFLTQFFKN